MQVQMMKSKIHRVTVTQADLNYVGSITIDESLMEAAGLMENEKVHVLNISNGERMETYVIRGGKDSGTICMNGPAARKVQVGDVVIVIAYAWMNMEEALQFVPQVIFPDSETNSLINQ